MQRTTTAARAIKELLKANHGRFFTVTFVKANGELRTINCKHGHRPGHDGLNNVAHIEKYLTVSLPDGSFRNINMETVKEVKMGGTILRFE